MDDAKLVHSGESGLERLCADGGREHIIHDFSLPGLERMEAQFSGEAFAPHRHDTYALGITLSGVQTFRYRGEKRFSLPGNCIILHPDELHDGAAGDEAGLKYRMLYLEPALLAPALGDAARSLPFIADPVVSHPGLARLLASVLSTMGDRLEDLEADGFLALLAPMLAGLSSEPAKNASLLPLRELDQVRDFLTEHANENIASSRLEDISGLDRFTLARHFRALYGTTPHRFMIMRRLAAAREKIGRGIPLADIAAETGFADQAHLTRHFKKTYGMPPGRWAKLASKGLRAG